MKPVVSPASEQADAVARQPVAAEAVREKLRAMMKPASDEMPDWVAAEFERKESRPGVYERLKGTALTGVRELFHTALADTLGIAFRQAQALTLPSASSDLLAALKFLELPEEHAFVIAAALNLAEFGHPESIRLFFRRYHLIHREAAADRIRGLREATLAAQLNPEPAPTALLHAPADSPGRPAAFGKALKAS